MFSKSALDVSSKWQIFTCFGCFCTLIRRKREICQTFYPIISGWYKCARWRCNSALKLDKTYSVSRLYKLVFKINRIYESYKKVMLSNAFTPSFSPYAQLSSVV